MHLLSAERIDSLEAAAYTIPTDGPDGTETDGTLAWSTTTIVIVHARTKDRVGLGYTYADASIVQLITSQLAPIVIGRSLLELGAIWRDVGAALRNVGRPGAGAMALSAVDIALWDLKARCFERPLIELLPSFRSRIPAYGSGGFCNYSLDRLARQLSEWIEHGIRHVKIKVGRRPQDDAARLDAARHALGDSVELFVDANGAYSTAAAVAWAQRLRDRWQVKWLEEPVSSADLEGLRFVRAKAPPGLEIAAGEYAYVPRDFVNLVEAQAVDCLQADVTRCGGITGLLSVAGFCATRGIDLSAHCAPAVSAHALCGVERARHLEHFHDHARVERMLFDGTPKLQRGELAPDASRPGLGLELKRQDAERHVHRS